jgi:hypothetical protein
VRLLQSQPLPKDRFCQRTKEPGKLPGAFEILRNNPNYQFHPGPRTDGTRLGQDDGGPFEGFIRYHQIRQSDHVQTTEWGDHQYWFRIRPGRVFGANYSAAKEGIIGLTRAVAKELGRFNVRCNAIRPRAATTITEGIEFDRFLAVMRALGRYWFGHRANIPSMPEVFKPEAVASLVVWLCTDDASNVNGRDFYVGGNEVGLFPELEVQNACFIGKAAGIWTRSTALRGITWSAI